MTAAIQIKERKVGGGADCFLIVEVGQAHNGSFQCAHEYVDAVAETGADAIKFQTHLAEFESSLDEPFRIKMNGLDKTRFDYWKRMEFSETQWADLASYALRKGLIFLSSAFSVEAVTLLSRIGMSAWKLGSGEFRSSELVAAIAKAGGPILLSTGMSRYDEITLMVDHMRKNEIPFALMQCTSRYPTEFAEVGLNVMDEFRVRYNCPAGLSDHSGNIYPGLAAMARGADVLEVHVVLDRRQSGPDATSSLTPPEIRELSTARNAFGQMNRAPVEKDRMAENMREMRSLFTKSIAPVRPLEAGVVLTEDLLVPRKPGTGIPYSERSRILGKRLCRAVSPLHVLDWRDVE